MPKIKPLVRNPWTKEDVRTLNAHPKARTPVAKIAMAVKPTEGAVRQEANTTVSVLVLASLSIQSASLRRGRSRMSWIVVTSTPLRKAAPRRGEWFGQVRTPSRQGQLPPFPWITNDSLASCASFNCNSQPRIGAAVDVAVNVNDLSAMLC
jgi:hypothetical protein